MAPLPMVTRRRMERHGDFLPDFSPRRYARRLRQAGQRNGPTVSCVFVSIPNVLATRYASAEMVAIWSPEAKVVAERRLWLAVLRAQKELGAKGVDVPS